MMSDLKAQIGFFRLDDHVSTPLGEGVIVGFQKGSEPRVIVDLGKHEPGFVKIVHSFNANEIKLCM
jgi:hypothetical protein